MVTDFIFFEYTSKNVSSKCGQGFFDSTKRSAKDAMKTASKGTMQKIAEAIWDFRANRIADKIAKNSSNKKKSAKTHKDTYHQVKDNKLLRLI